MNAEATADPVAALPGAHGPPPVSGLIKRRPEDFQVGEVLGFEPSGAGEHVFLEVEKRGLNTERVAHELARFADVRPGDVGYAGLKDRNAVTRQFFTVHMPGRPDPNWSALALEGAAVLASARHHRKLRRGALRGNRFRIAVRGARGDRHALAARVEALRRLGVPNYFGPQRFGRGGDNVRQAELLFAGEGGRVPRHRRGIYLSAARSQLFNAVLARRVSDGTWDRGLDGEIYRLDGSRAVFGPEPPSAEIERRLQAHDIHPTGPLWGRGPLSTAGDCRALETEVLDPFGPLRRGLERFGLKQERRALRVTVQALEFALDGNDLALEFALEPGAYATVVLRELVSCGK